MQYFSYPPSRQLAAYIKCYWTLDDNCVYHRRKERIFPDGCIELIFHYGDRFKKYINEREGEIQPRSFLHGQLRRFMEVEAMGKIGVFSVRFMPHGIARFLKTPLDELTGKTISIHDLWGKEGSILEEKIMDASSTLLRIKLMENFLLARMTSDQTRWNAIDHCVHHIGGANYLTSINGLAKDVNLGRRQLERKFLEVVGLNPKMLTRIIRFQQVLKHLERDANVSLTEVAYANGYYDQSHFIKDFKEFTGFNPKQYFCNQLEFAKHLFE